MKKRNYLLAVLCFCSFFAVAQNVGIGTTTPNAPLQFGNGTANRKIVLFDVNNNEHQFFGFGLNSGELRYQINEATSGVAHKFFAGIDAATSIELMRIQGNGNVGIGSTNPALAGLVVDKKAGAVHAMFGSSSSGIAIESGNPIIGFNTYLNGTRKLMVNGYGAYIGSSNVLGGLQLAVTDVAALGGSTVSPITAIDIKPNGNVGIGTVSSNAPLQFGNGTANRKIVLYDVNNNDHEFFGFGLNSGELRYQINSTGSSHKFFAGLNAAASTELMRIQGNGNVGIGTVTPNASLQLGNVAANRRFVLWETANNDHQFYGFGINGFTLRYQTPSSSDDHVFYSGSGASSSTELVRIKGDGNVGIGNNDPAYRLDVKGRIHIRADGATAGIWFNNSLNTQLRGFIGMENEDVFGLYGDAGAGWALRMSTSSGDIEAAKNVTINGFTRLGELSPGIKTKIIVGTVPALGIANYHHGLSNSSKIVSIDALATVAGSSGKVKPGFWLGAGFTYQLLVTDTDVSVVAPPIPFDCAFVAGQTVKIFITYIE